MATPDPSSVQPKIVHKLLIRTTGFLFACAAIFGGIRYVQSLQGDYDRGGDSTGMIAAIRFQPDGQQAVLIKPDGTVTATSSWKAGVTDREPAWEPDGKHLFFCSDRKDATFHIMRWNPQKDDAEARTHGAPSRGYPTFAPGGGLDSLLIVAGGTVRALDPTRMETPQVLPPTNAEIAQSKDPESGGGGAEGSFDAIYGTLGKSFRIARYLPGKRYIAAVMKRDEGELLMVQDLQPVNDKLPRPHPIAAGDRIDFDIDSKNGIVAFTVQNFKWPDPSMAPPQYKKNGKITVPFRNMVGMFDLSKGEELIGASSDDAIGFTSPRISPDGARLLLVVGSFADGGLVPKSLMIMPLQQQGLQSRSAMVMGEVYEPSWSTDGSKIVYAKRVNGKRDLFTIGSDGTGETSITKGQGDFATPLFSPMTK